MKRRWVTAGALACVVAFGTIPAQGGAAVGICLINLRFDFVGEVSNNSPPTTYSMSGTGTCQTSAGIGKTGVIGGIGFASLSHCATLVLNGTYGFDLFPEPAPPDTSGQFNYIGTASAGLGRFDGNPPPLFVGVAVMAGAGLLPCLGGTHSLTFTTVIAFVDP